MKVRTPSPSFLFNHPSFLFSSSAVDVRDQSQRACRTSNYNVLACQKTDRISRNFALLECNAMLHVILNFLPSDDVKSLSIIFLYRCEARRDQCRSESKYSNKSIQYIFLRLQSPHFLINSELVLVGASSSHCYTFIQHYYGLIYHSNYNTHNTNTNPNALK